jgi:hypothetical protein
MSPLSTTSEIKMIRNTEIEIHGTQVPVKYKIEDGDVMWVTPIINCQAFVCDWLLDIDSIREALEDHHANLLEEENINV